MAEGRDGKAEPWELQEPVTANAQTTHTRRQIGFVDVCVCVYT